MMQFEKVLVTGAGGLLGKYVVHELKGQGVSVSGLDLLPLAEGDLPFIQGSVEDASAVAKACRGQDAVVHVAARPNIWSGNGNEIMSTNVVGTWNVLAAAEEAGVKRVILTSSDSVTGFTVLQGSMLPPEYLPVDQDHPRNATDPYALSKVLCEDLGRSFSLRGKMEIIVIRPVYVLYPEFECEVRARAADPDNYKGPAAGGRQPAGGGPMWHYVDPRDLARAFRLALDVKKPKFAAYVISARNMLAPEPTIERLARITGKRIPVKKPDVYKANPFAPLYDLSAARDDLGFEAEHDMRQLLYPNG
jgi:nucleoside-diphosphate-sugar epimerase